MSIFNTEQAMLDGEQTSLVKWQGEVLLVTAQPEAIAPHDSGFLERMVSKGRAVKEPTLWNFEKFLTSRNGTLVQRFSPDMEPENRRIADRINAAAV